MDTADTPRPSDRLRPALPKPFDVRWADGLQISLPHPISMSDPGRPGSATSRAGLDEGRWRGQEIRTCEIDLRPCRWADPLPLLSLALSLANFEARVGEV
ncbi:MAG: hypothetical protein IPK63_10220 [Candidatus Competibacteraceae bacterium]|nr:hypothetical protein [Candidatus Competibacteraceae bacterium]